MTPEHLIRHWQLLTLEDYSRPPSTNNHKEVVHGHAKRCDTPPPLSQGTINSFSIDQYQLSESGGLLNFPGSLDEITSLKMDVKPRCWNHGCNGREFSSKSNFVRHKKEKEGEAAKVICPLCGGIFSRNSARDTHIAKQSCNRIRRYSNGRPRPSKVALLSGLDFAQDTKT